MRVCLCVLCVELVWEREVKCGRQLRTFRGAFSLAYPEGGMSLLAEPFVVVSAELEQLLKMHCEKERTILVPLRRHKRRVAHNGVFLKKRERNKQQTNTYLCNRSCLAWRRSCLPL